jgi:hypothetical protein
MIDSERSDQKQARPSQGVVPGIGPILTAGLIGSALLSTVEAAAVGAGVAGGTSALAAALISWGVSKDKTTSYDANLKENKLLVIASGNAAEVTGVRQILVARGAQVDVHSR